MSFICAEPVFLANPFLDAYATSDLLGKCIFLGLVALSVLTWSVLIYKLWLISKVRKESLEFRYQFLQQKTEPLQARFHVNRESDCPNAFYILYEVLKNKSLEILQKNQNSEESAKKGAFLSDSDINLIDAHLGTTISSLTKFLDKNVYILSTVVTLAPFLGLLGTVYGILTTFSDMQSTAMQGSSQVLSGLSLALCTTVVGLIDAIPALIGYNYIKNKIQSFDAEMDLFATDALSSVELQYKKVVE